MLEEMRIRALGVIDDAVLHLAPGLTAITGETGAGKTMVVTGLGLLFGGRADSAAVRAGGGPALIEGLLRIDPSGAVASRSAEAGADLDEDALLLARTVTSEGRSRAHVGGRSVPIGVLAELAEHCLAVHGQADQFRLLNAGRQRQALDRFAGSQVEGAVAAFSTCFVELRSLEREIAEITALAAERAREAGLLRLGLDEVAVVAPQPDEDLELAAEDERLSHADGLRAAAAVALASLTGDAGAAEIDGGDAASLIGAAGLAVERAGAYDPTLEALAARLRELGYLIADVGADLASYAAGIETDEARLSTVQQRRAVLARLARTYARETGTVREVLVWCETSARRLSEIEDDDSRIDELRTRALELRHALAEQAVRLTGMRERAAERLAAAVTAELVALAMPGASLLATVRQTDTAGGLVVPGKPTARSLSFGPHGVDEVELLLCPHPGAPPRPLHKGASGGELSRVMLALEVVLAGTDPVPTMVFDEVDAGVGGKAAVEVGRRLAKLAQTAQVIVVTHLPQVAAFADSHLVVQKSSDGAITTSGIVALDDEGRVAELSRMFAGLEQSDSARAHAMELLAAAGRPVAQQIVAARA